MNTMFGEWYREAEIEPKNDELALRWQVVEKLKTQSQSDYAANLVRLHLGLPGIPEDFLTSFRAAFFDVDNTFRMTGNDVELRVLAGAVLIEVVGRNDTFSDGVAMLIAGTAFPERRKKTLLKDVLTTAAQHLFDRGLAVRQVAMKPASALASVDPTLASLKESMATNPATSWTHVYAAFKTLAENMAKLHQNTDERWTLLERQQRFLQEESNIVWWVFGGAVRNSLKRYSELDLAEAIVSAAVDLASLTLTAPPPIAAPAYLDRMLGVRSAETVSLHQLSGASSSIAGSATAGFFPVSSCLDKVRAGMTAKESAALVTRAFHLQAGSAQAKILSLQLYRELLAQRFLQGKG
jgi:hypothetical protein